jgi:hypothetical protein
MGQRMLKKLALALVAAWIATSVAFAQPATTKPNLSGTLTQCGSNVPIVGSGAGASPVCGAGGLVGTGATLQATPTAPTGTASTTPVMMGLGSTCKLTPVFSTRVRVSFFGSIDNNTAAAVTDLRVFFGTGTAPSNGAAQTGTEIGTFVAGVSTTASATLPLANGGIATGLTPGTQIWLDIGLDVSSGTGALISVACTAEEF